MIYKCNSIFLEAAESLESFLGGQFLAVGEHDLLEKNDARPDFIRICDQYDLVPSLQGISRPANPVQHRGIRSFGDPMLDDSFVVRHVEIHLRMRVAVLEFRDSRLIGSRLRHVVSRIPVMSEQRGGNHKQSENNYGGMSQLSPHVIPLK